MVHSAFASKITLQKTNNYLDSWIILSQLCFHEEAKLYKREEISNVGIKVFIFSYVKIENAFTGINLLWK